MAVLRQPFAHRRIHLDFESSTQTRLEAVAQAGDPPVGGYAVGHRGLHRRDHADDAGDVVGPRSPPELLAAAMDHGLEFHAVAHIQQTHALGTTELVRGERDQVAGGATHGDVPREKGLDRIRVDEHVGALGPYGRSDCGNRLNDTRLVVGVHHGHHTRRVVDGSRDVRRIHPAPRVDPDDRGPTAEAFYEVRCFQNGFVFRGSRHHAPHRLTSKCSSGNSEVVGFGAAAGEDDLERPLGAEQDGRSLACLLQGVLGASRHAVET